MKKKTTAKTAAQMDYFAAQKLFQSYKIPTCPMHKAVKEKDVMGLEKRLPFPWAMKATGKHLIHKTDVGGVHLNITNTHDAMMAVHTMKKIKGYGYVVIQPMRKGVELIVGGKMDPQFGPTVLVGMGGIYTEVFKDSSVRIAPITEKDAKEMLHELQISPILEGVRGRKGVNEKQLTQLLMGVSRLMVEKQPKELDLNPVIATPETAEAVDVRIIL
jgi:acyl-CoA synthetase (NDP forming)